MEIKEFSESNIILQDCYNGHLAHFQYTSLSRLRKKFFHSTLIYTPLKRPILYLKHSNTQRKVYHTMPLHTYTSNFTTSSTLQEILSNSPLIIYGIIMYIGHKHHSHI